MSVNAEDQIDTVTFGQILELDDPGENSASVEIVNKFKRDTEDTVAKLTTALEEQDLEVLARLAHYFQGAASKLGLIKVQYSAFKIQHYAKLEDENGQSIPDEAFFVQKIQEELVVLQENLNVCYELFDQFFENGSF